MESFKYNDNINTSAPTRAPGLTPVPAPAAIYSRINKQTLNIMIQEYLALEAKFGKDFEKGYYLGHKAMKYQVTLMELFNEIEVYKKN